MNATVDVVLDEEARAWRILDEDRDASRPPRRWRSSSRRRQSLLALVFVALTAGRAAAHQSSIKYVDVTVEDTRATVRFTVAPSDVTEPLGLSPDARPELADALTPAVASYVAGWLAIGCPARPAAAEPDADRKFIVVVWQVECGSAIGELQLDFTRFFAVDQRHEAILTMHTPGVEGEPSIIRGAAPVVAVHAGETPSTLAWIHYGIDHIYSGRDHISFVLALLLAIVLVRGADGWQVRAPRSALRSTATIITAFTVAHSLSLIAASLGWVQLPSRLVESLIAVSITYTAIEDIIRPDVRWRFVLTFGFGLVHGLGFASVLREILPANHIIVPLLCFNLGVELGQLTIVLVALPVFWLLAKELGALRYRRVIMPVLAALIAVLGLVWLIERVFTIRLLGM